MLEDLHTPQSQPADGTAVAAGDEVLELLHPPPGVAYAAGYTGLGVATSRFGATVALDLLMAPSSDLLTLRYVRSRPFPFPPEPLRWLGITLTRRALARADRRSGKRGPWLRLLDRFGVGFDS